MHAPLTHLPSLHDTTCHPRVVSAFVSTQSFGDCANWYQRISRDNFDFVCLFE